MKVHVKKGDIVKVIAGDDKGHQGKVLSVDISHNRAIVEGVNLVKKHTKPNAKHPEGGILVKESSIHISNLMLIDEKGVATRIGRRLEDGKIVRYSKKTGEEIK